jgi:hypothetical protein
MYCLQEIPSILQNSNAHYGIPISPPLAPVLTKIKPDHVTAPPPSYSFTIHFNIFFPSTPYIKIIA